MHIKRIPQTVYKEARLTAHYHCCPLQTHKLEDTQILLLIELGFYIEMNVWIHKRLLSNSSQQASLTKYNSVAQATPMLNQGPSFSSLGAATEAV